MLDHQYTVTGDEQDGQINVVSEKAEPTPYEHKLDTVVSKAVMQSSHLKPVVNDRLRSVVKVKGALKRKSNCPPTFLNS